MKTLLLKSAEIFVGMAVLVWLGVASLFAREGSCSTILGVKPHHEWLKSVLNQHENPLECVGQF
jgi:hypothetical protein